MQSYLYYKCECLHGRVDGCLLHFAALTVVWVLMKFLIHYPVNLVEHIGYPFLLISRAELQVKASYLNLELN